MRSGDPATVHEVGAANADIKVRPNALAASTREPNAHTAVKRPCWGQSDGRSDGSSFMA